METNYYLGGYYLILQNPITYWGNKIKVINSASGCFNDHLLNGWSYSWSSNNNPWIDKIKHSCLIDDSIITAIRKWTMLASAAGKIGLPNVFADLDTLNEYRKTFSPICLM
ncbi:hypothetical protein [Dyadobacter sp. NIV53]|uniref:hypothetical protein n=1 Tax=Dyadobacter sp. NIV53 TaxID=2861765 RepID=UPI001C8744AF|nr:hypothetical protein [Dyadobacter sp. NIV53]